ncbi:hypothetical protein LTR17_026043 [Elasticomyces elasticus]|nr:hypothetical protein LTR17_026043 [Elasticomyces elasticus]
MADLHKRQDACGYTDLNQTAMTFLPNGTLPTPANVDGDVEACGMWNDVVNAAMLVNPCWDIYQIPTTCPLLAMIYFNRTDVQKPINAPTAEWEEYSGGVLDTDTLPPSGLSVPPRVIEKNNRTIIAHGMLDFILLVNDTILMIQNMTWNGAQGFSTPSNEWDNFFCPLPQRV